MEIKRGNPKIFDQINLRLKELGSKQGKVGWFESSRYGDGTPVAAIAAQNEFGNAEKNIPPRPTIRPAAIENQAKWESVAAQGANQILAGKAMSGEVMEKLTITAQNDILKNIAALTAPPLKESTLAKRRSRGNNSTKPLVDTRLEFNTLESVVEDANS